MTVCTGCFLHEHLALEHLREVRAAMGANGYTGTLHVLSSVLTTAEGMDAAAGLGPFHLTPTAECFTERRQILKESKAKLTPEEMVAALARGKEWGHHHRRHVHRRPGPDRGGRRTPAGLRRRHDGLPRFRTYPAHNLFMDVYRTRVRTRSSGT
ncbi:hypothetical protein ACWCPF_43745 [Streptomyces sp. NPDC001858]